MDTLIKISNLIPNDQIWYTISKISGVLTLGIRRFFWDIEKSYFFQVLG
jgi:hypothetical protein